MRNIIESVGSPSEIYRSARHILRAQPVDLGATDLEFADKYRTTLERVRRAPRITSLPVGLGERNYDATIVQVGETGYFAVINPAPEIGEEEGGRLWSPRAVLAKVGLANRNGHGGNSEGAILRATLSGEITAAYRFKNPALAIYLFSTPDTQEEGFGIFVSSRSPIPDRPLVYGVNPVFYALDQPGRRIVGK